MPKAIANWSLTSLQQRLVKTDGRLIKHARYYWLLLAESHLTRRLLWRHVAKNCDAAGASKIGGPGERSRFLVTRLADGEVSVESIGQTAVAGIAWPRDAKSTPPEPAGSTVAQNRTKTLRREAVWSKTRVEIGESKREFRINEIGDQNGNSGLAKSGCGGNLSEARIIKFFA